MHDRRGQLDRSAASGERVGVTGPSVDREEKLSRCFGKRVVGPASIVRNCPFDEMVSPRFGHVTPELLGSGAKVLEKGHASSI